MSNKALREAFIDGARHIREVYNLPGQQTHWLQADTNAAKELYPPKTETRPRQVTQDSWWFEVRDGELWGSCVGPAAGWISLVDYGSYNPGTDRLTTQGGWANYGSVIYDLFKNPLETVEVDD